MKTPDFDPLFELRGEMMAMHAICAHTLTFLAAIHAGVNGTTHAEELDLFADGVAEAGLAAVEEVAKLGSPAATAGFNRTIEAMRVGLHAMAEASRRG